MFSDELVPSFPGYSVGTEKDGCWYFDKIVGNIDPFFKILAQNINLKK